MDLGIGVETFLSHWFEELESTSMQNVEHQVGLIPWSQGCKEKIRTGSKQGGEDIIPKEEQCWIDRRCMKTLVIISVMLGGCVMMHQLITSSALTTIISRNSRLQAVKSCGPPPIRRILLVTYGRSGSTFTSYILKEALNSFFYFEPLRPLLMRHTKGSDIIMNYTMIGGKLMAPREFQLSELTAYERKAIDIVNRSLGCDFSTYPVHDYRSHHFLWHGDSSNLTRCLWTMNNSNATNLSKYLQCLYHFWTSCKHTQERVIKVIRLPLRGILPLLRSQPHLTVVYLVRDPRAILISQKLVFFRAPKAQDFCDMVEDDIFHFKLLQQKYPNRAFMIRYEDISTFPLKWVERLYQALHLSFTPKVADHIKQMISAPKEKERTYDPYRSDSKKTANRWRDGVKYAMVKEYDKVCSRVYKMLGYSAVHSEALLRNVSIPLFVSPQKISYLFK